MLEQTPAQLAGSMGDLSFEELGPEMQEILTKTAKHLNGQAKRLRVMRDKERPDRTESGANHGIKGT
jgi:hypothetical protein